MINDFSRRIQEMLNALSEMAAGDLSKRPPISARGDELDAIAYAVTLLSDEMVAMNKRLAIEQEKAIQASQAKSRFLANMSHEIRTPLTAIMGFVDLLHLENVSARKRKHHLNRIANNSQGLKRLVDDALDLMKVEAGEITLVDRVVNVRREIKDVIRDIRAQIQKPEVTLNLVFKKSVPKTLALDVDRIRQVLSNLVGNSLKFTDKGHIRVSLDFNKKKKTLALDVRDTGIGVSRNFMDRLFQPFSQGQEGIDRKFGGTGLGLALSRALCHAMGGDLVLVSSHQGKGSHFRATAFAVPNTKKIVKPKAPFATQRSLTGLRILLVEDSPDNREMFTQMLEHWGSKIDSCSNGYDALKTIRKGYDLILMDIQMPGMDGITATQRLRQDGYVLPIIALTANAMAGERERCISLGFTDYVSKPVEWSSLVATIQESVAKPFQEV